MTACGEPLMFTGSSQHNITSYIKVTKFKYLCGAYNGILDLIQPTVIQCARGNAWFRMCFSLWKRLKLQKACIWLNGSLHAAKCDEGGPGSNRGYDWWSMDSVYLLLCHIHKHSHFPQCKSTLSLSELYKHEHTGVVYCNQLSHLLWEAPWRNTLSPYGLGLLVRERFARKPVRYCFRIESIAAHCSQCISSHISTLRSHAPFLPIYALIRKNQTSNYSPEEVW